MPEVSGEGHGVGFVGHAETQGLVRGTSRLETGGAVAVRTGEVKGEAEDALDALAGVDVLLSGDFVGSSPLEEAASADVDAFGVFAKDDETNVVESALLERSKALVEKFGGTGVNEEVELEAQAQEDVGGVLIGGDTRVAESAEEDGVKFIAKHFDGAFRESDVFAEELVGAPVELDEFDVAATLGDRGFDDGDGDGSDFFADAITGNDGDAGVGAARPKRGVGHEGDSVERNVERRYVSTGGEGVVTRGVQGESGAPHTQGGVKPPLQGPQDLTQWNRRESGAKAPHSIAK